MASTALNTQPLVHTSYLISPEDMLVSSDPNFKGEEPCAYLKGLDQAEFQILRDEDCHFLISPKFPIYKFVQINLSLLVATYFVGIGDPLTAAVNVVATEIAILGLYYFCARRHGFMSSAQTLNKRRIDRLGDKMNSIFRKIAENYSESSLNKQKSNEIREVNVLQLQQAHASCKLKLQAAESLQTKLEGQLHQINNFIEKYLS